MLEILLLVPKKVCKSFTSRCVFCNVAFFSCSAVKLSTEPKSTNLSDILKIKRRLPSFRAKNDVACRTITFHKWKTLFVQSDAANDNFSLVKFHLSRRWLASTKNRTIFSSLSFLWINLSTYKIKIKKTLFQVLGLCVFPNRRYSSNLQSSVWSRHVGAHLLCTNMAAGK